MKTRFKMGGVVNSDVEKAVALLAETDLGKEKKIVFSGLTFRSFGLGFLHFKKRKADERSDSD